jgi:hypothetical protein
MIFRVILPFSMDKSITFENTQVMIVSYFLLILYFFMYALNMFWFYKIMLGLLKALGIIKKKEKKPKTDTNKVE